LFQIFNMKKILACLLIATVTSWTAQAQLSEGGFPLSMQSALKEQYVPVSSYSLPDWNSAMAKNELAEAAGKPQPYLLALFTATDVSFPTSGVFARADNGHQVWRTKVKVDGAKALGLYYDKFQLPKGVNMYVTNANGYQVLGAYSSNNNDPSKTFVNEAVQGSVVTIEMDIAPGVNLNDIEMHIDRTAVYFRGIEYLAQFTIDPSKLHEMDHMDSLLAGGSSKCMINAICPAGVNYPNQRKASFQLIVSSSLGVGACSATMLNNTGNTTSNCKQYFLTATHCDPDNGSTNAHFNQLIMRFNFEQSTCLSSAIPQSNTLTGANFIARANHDHNAPLTSRKGDFMLLEVRTTIPAAWNVIFAGWNRNPNIQTTATLPKKFIGFHHPDGDVKKVSSTQEIESGSLDGSTTPNGTHWGMLLTEGLGSTGASGSGLFDGDGYLIGDISVGGAEQMDPTCLVTATGDTVDGTGNFVLYSKFAYDWDYSIDGSANNRKLKPWLDPANTGAVTINPVKSNCTAIGGTGITITNGVLDNAISIYPNPSATGMVQVKINLADQADLTMDLYDITGKRLNSFKVDKIRSGSYTLDLSQYSNGMYLLKCSDGNSVSSKKIMLSK
jgi:lysyl endopeptidase